MNKSQLLKKIQGYTYTDYTDEELEQFETLTRSEKAEFNYRHYLKNKQIFRADIESAFGIEHNSKADLLWDTINRSDTILNSENEFEEIYYQYVELVELIK